MKLLAYLDIEATRISRYPKLLYVLPGEIIEG